jgi:hypothetical protein
LIQGRTGPDGIDDASVGHGKAGPSYEPDDASIKAAIEANDAFIDRLTAIRDAAPTLAVERDE